MIRVMTRLGRTAHLLTDAASPNSSWSAICGTSPWPDLWYGTGSQDEEDALARLPLCQKCSIERTRREGREAERAARHGCE